MKKIDSILDTLKSTLKYKDIKPVKKFYSKRNDVYSIDVSGKDKSCKYILKVFNSTDCMERIKREVYFLSRAIEKGLPVPDLVFSGDKYLLTTYIDGINLVDRLMIDEEKGNTDIDIFVDVCRFSSNFNQIDNGAFKYILGDMNLRNYIISDRLYRIDFEDVHRGVIEEDLGKYCAFYLTYIPEFTEWKIFTVKKIIEYIIKNIKVDKKKFSKEIKMELDSINKRRNITIPYDRIGHLLEN